MAGSLKGKKAAKVAEYSNAQLAHDYYEKSTIESCNFFTRSSRLLRIRDVVAKSRRDIPGFFLAHGESLKELAIEGVGDETKKTLERILAKKVGKLSHRLRVDYVQAAKQMRNSTITQELRGGRAQSHMYQSFDSANGKT